MTSSTPQPSAHYDLIIIGTGSGNSIPGPEFEDKSIAIIEKGTFGGTCLNEGCIPTKMYVYAADVALAARQAGKLGVEATVNNVDWQSIVDRVFTNRIDPIAQGGEQYRRGNENPNITVYAGHARFAGPKLVEVNGEYLSADDIVIAAGARPFIPPVFANSGVRYYTNEDIMRLPQQPKKLIIVGGGYIAMEFAHVFDGLGTKVTIVNRSQTVLRFLDETLCDRFNELAKQRFDFRIGTGTKLSESATGVVLTLDNGEEIEADAILVATGRVPNGDQMNLGSAGIRTHADGRIEVDEYGRTSTPGVWALGDVSSPYMLKHVANAETRAVKHNLANPSDMQKMPHDLVPYGVFTHPQIATVGLTEQQAREQGRELTVKVQAYGDVAMGWAMEDSAGLVKLIADKETGRLLGAHILGAQATTLIQQLITVMAYDIDLRGFARNQYWIHPGLPEVVENALLGLDWE
ncbi:mycothione reductase [Corynebacterium phocae]|uniref:Mycothione reductase n=1 Tax=Corynebacterium phocae TaxID=161895 RepID=A0A1L7D2I3_9CORY|nr:mycothione reductase [Corynebacterium phocae]APT92328.1 mycothione reductase [Corynebacterium phocae]KAA8724919.1 mycothione reductase [Corynebacterium phocae]